MADQENVVKCPLCEGQGELHRSQLMDRLTHSNLRQELEICLAETTGEVAEAVAVHPEPRNFQKEVHTWNPQLPIWRRSPKE